MTPEYWLLAAIGVAALVAGLPALLRAWRQSRRPENFLPDRAANDPEH